MLYYVAAELAIEHGHSGTNLVFLGDKVEPQSLTIENEAIKIDSIDYSDKSATTMKALFVRLVSNELKLVPNPSEIDSSATTTSQL